MKRFSLLLQEIFLQAFPDCLNFSFWNAKMKKIFGHRKSGTQQQIKWHFYDVYFRKHLLLLCKVCFRKYESIHRLPMYRTQVAANSAWQQTDLKNLLFFIPNESEIYNSADKKFQSCCCESPSIGSYIVKHKLHTVITFWHNTLLSRQYYAGIISFRQKHFFISHFFFIFC